MTLVKRPPYDPPPIVVPVRPGVLQLKEVALCHMLSASLQLTAQAGNIECNPSNLKSLDNAMQHALRNLDEFTARRVATWALKAGDTALKQSDAPNEVSRCLGVAYAVLKSVELQHVDANTLLAATALSITLESELENDTVWRVATQPKMYAEQILRCLDRELRDY
jgi:hypothetical protein